MWTFIQNTAAPKAEASNGVESKPSDSKPVLTHLTPQIKFELRQKAKANNAVISQVKKMPNDCLTIKIDNKKLVFEEIEHTDKPTEISDDKLIGQPKGLELLKSQEPSDEQPAATETKESEILASKSTQFFQSAKQYVKRKYSGHEGQLFEEFELELRNLGSSNIPNDIIVQFKNLLVNLAELEQKENFIRYEQKYSEGLKEGIKETLIAMDGVLKGSLQDPDALNTSLTKLDSIADQLLKSREETHYFRAFVFHLKSFISSVAKWATQLGAAAGLVGGIAGASVGAAGGTVAALVVSSPIGGVAAPLGTAVGTSAGFGVGAVIGCISGGIAGAGLGLFKAAKTFVVTEEVMTKDAVSSLTDKIRAWRPTSKGD